MPATRSPSTRPARPQRADARRNVAAILDAAVLCLTRNPDASIADIAEAAGVGRVTVYGHFKTRPTSSMRSWFAPLPKPTRSSTPPTQLATRAQRWSGWLTRRGRSSISRDLSCAPLSASCPPSAFAASRTGSCVACSP